MKHFLAACFLVLSATVRADIRYVSPTGLDTNPGTMEAPIRTVQAAVNKSLFGDKILLMDGDFGGGVWISAKSGVTIGAVNPGKASITGGTATRPDGIALNSSPGWTFEDLIVQGGKVGINVGSSNGVTIRRCVIRQCSTQGIKTGSSSLYLIEDNDIYLVAAEHGIYNSGAIDGGTVRRNRISLCGKSGIQVNSQGAGGVAKHLTLENNSIWGVGKNGAAGINIIGVQESTFAGNSLTDCFAGGISFSTNGMKLPDGSLDPRGFCSNNTVYACSITVRPGEGRTCIQQNYGSLSVTGCRMWAGKTVVQPITALNGATIMQVGNTILSPMEAVQSGGTTPAPESVTGG